MNAQNAILNLLRNRLPNFVGERLIKKRLSDYDENELTETLNELVKSEKIDDRTDPWGFRYFKIKGFDNIPHRETIKVGEVEVPRQLYGASPYLWPEEFNEAVERLADYTASLEKKFSDLVRKEQQKYWQNIVGIFGIFVAVLAFILVGLPKIQTNLTLPFWEVIIFNLAQVLPLAVVLAIFVLVLRLIIR